MGADILNLLVLWLLYIFPCIVNAMIKYSLLLSESNLSERLSISLYKAEVLIIFEFINNVSISYYICIEFIILLYAFLVISLIDIKNK